MLKAIIVEDVHDNIATLKYLLKESVYEFDIVAVADNLEKAKVALQIKNIDVAFLDIQLKDGIIFDILDELKQEEGFNFELVFTTAFSDFEMAVKAIQFACLDYLTKPLQQDKLDEVLKKIVAKKSNGTQDNQLTILLDAVKNNYNFPKSLSVSLARGVIEVVNIDEIQYLQADRNTCIFYLSGNRSIHSTKNFAYYLDLFCDHSNFIQINRSNFINKNKVKRYNHRTKELILQEGVKLVVSHRMNNMVKIALKNQRFGLGGLIDLYSRLTGKL